jgi:hypothetical protein
MSTQPPPNDNVELANPSESGKSSSSSIFNGLEDVAKSAWNSVSNIKETVLNATAYSLQVAGEGLPKVALVADDTDKNKPLWDSFGNDARSGSARIPHLEFDLLKEHAVNDGTAGQPTKETKDGKDSTRNSADQAAKPAETGTFADKAFDWLKSGWNSLFGSPYKSTEGTRTRQTTDADGNVSEIVWGKGSVEHKCKDGTTRADAKHARHVDGRGDQAFMDRTTKELSEKGVNGTVAILDKNGRYHVEDGHGNKVEWQDGHLMAVSKDGTETEITDKAVIQKFRQSEWRVRQARKHGDRGECQHNRPSVETVTDDQNDAQQMVLINDGKGTLVKVHQDGKKEIVVGEGENQTTFMMKPGSKEILALRGDEKAILRRENGQWKVYDLEGNELNSQSGGLGGSLSGADGEIKVSSSTTIKKDGTVDTANDQGQHVQVAAAGTSAVLKDLHGEGKDVRVAVHGGTSTVQSNEPGAIGTTSVDTTSSAVWQKSGDGNGQTRDLFTLDPTKPDFLTVHTADGDIKANKDAEGHEKLILWNGDEFNTDSHTLKLHDGTEFDAWNDLLKFPDGTWLDSLGDLYDLEEEFIGNSEEEYYEELEENQALTQSLVDMAQTLAAAIAGRAGDATLGDVAQLLGLYSQLGGMKAQAMALGDLASFAKLDSALASTSSAINDAQIQLAQQEILRTLTTLSPDLLAQANHMMPSAVIPEALRQLLQNTGRIPKDEPRLVMV